MRRALFTLVVGAAVFGAVLLPTMPTSVPLAAAAALLTGGFAFAVWPWIVGRSGIDGCVERAVDGPRRAADAARAEL